MLIVFVNDVLCLDVLRDLDEGGKWFARPLVPSLLRSEKSLNFLRENVIVGAEQDIFEILSLIICIFCFLESLRWWRL